MNINEHDANFLKKSIFEGEAILIIGAGASVSSRNCYGEVVKAAKKLAEHLAEEGGLPYTGEDLTDVLGAVRGTIFSEQQLIRLLEREYKGVIPSSELQKIFNFTWKRIYTWNIDDSIEACTRYFSQNRRYHNGKIDKAVDFDGVAYVDVVHLHGFIQKPEHGFILSEAEYAEAIKSEKHYWYQRLAQDYLTQCPIFIGTQIAEPILSAELEKAKRDSGGGLPGRAFLITPDNLSPIKTASFNAKGIVHIQATLEQFVDWLDRTYPSGIAPKEVISRRNRFADSALEGLTKEELEAAYFIKPVVFRDLKENLARLTPAQKSGMARKFLTGFPPSWIVAASDIPADLDSNRSLYTALERAISVGQRLFVITGQSGSGKSNSVMMTLLKLCEMHPEVHLYEIDPAIKSMATAFKLLKRMHDKRVIVYVGDLFVYGDQFSKEIEEAGNDLTIVSTARQGEWNDRLSRHIGVIPFLFQRFSNIDYDPLIDRLKKYVPAPSFSKRTLPEQRKMLARSKNQLLIALKELTGSQNFTDVITEEFEGLPDRDTKTLLLIVGVATIARVGISASMAKEAYASLATGRTFHKATDALDGIVSIGDDGRVYARHELYVRHIIENVASFSEFKEVVQSVLKTFLKFKIPVIKGVNRLDGQLFKFLLNHRFIFETADRHGKRRDGTKIYEDFQIDFQLDGHFWLQYGLYLAALGDLVPAEGMLKRSIDAYPDNPYSVHAHADLQLKIATKSAAFDSTTRELIAGAVKTLKTLDANPNLEIDEYPIVTLAVGHVRALIAHREISTAKDCAKQYFDRLQQIEKQTASQSVSRAKERMLRFVSYGDFDDPASKSRVRIKTRFRRGKG